MKARKLSITAAPAPVADPTSLAEVWPWPMGYRIPSVALSPSLKTMAMAVQCQTKRQRPLLRCAGADHASEPEQRGDANHRHASPLLQ
jgi:hypothetical protein